MSLDACKQFVYILFQLRLSSSNCSIHFCSDFISGVNFLFISSLYLFVSLDLVICSRIGGFFEISTFSVLIFVFHEFGILCIRVKYFKKSPSGSVYFSFSLLNV